MQSLDTSKRPSNFVRPGAYSQHLLTIVLMIVFGAVQLMAQYDLWEESVQKGNKALATEDLESSESHYLNALDICAQFPAHDLRYPTTLRNLAQVYILQFRYVDAEANYVLALASAKRALPLEHIYIVEMEAEYLALQSAVRNSADYTPPVIVPLSFWDRLRIQGRWAANRITFQAGPILPVGSEMSQTHDGGMGVGFLFGTPFRLGAIPLVISVDQFRAKMPGKHADNKEFSISGTGLGLAASIGQAQICINGGAYNTRMDIATSQIGVGASFSYPIVGHIDQPDTFGPVIGIRLQALQLLESTDMPATTLARFGIIIGFRH